MSPFLHTWNRFQEGFYSAQEGVTVVLSWHFDFYCNDGYPVDGRTIIMVLGRLESAVRWYVMM